MLLLPPDICWLCEWRACALDTWADDIDSTTRHPFNDRIIASGSDDGKIFIWEVPKDFSLFTDAEEPADVAPVSKLTGHSRYGVHEIDTRKIESDARGHKCEEADNRIERSAKSCSTPRLRTSLPPPRATSPLSSGTLAPDRLRCSSSTTTLSSRSRGMPAATYW